VSCVHMMQRVLLQVVRCVLCSACSELRVGVCSAWCVGGVG